MRYYSFREGSILKFKEGGTKMKRLSSGVFIFLIVLGFSFTVFGAEKYPSKPVQFLIPFGAGGSADVMGRVLAQATEKYLGQPLVPINKPGAGGGIMYTALKNSKPDGYTLGWNSTSILTSTNIGNVPFTYEVFNHICRIGLTGMPIAVRSDAPWKTFAEFSDYVKKNPGKIKIGNAGTGSGTHLTAALIEQELGLKVIHVPLGAERRIPSLLGGEMDAICVPLPEIAPQVAAGKARVLVIPNEKRESSFPDVPTLKESGYPIVMELFRGISAPQGTPDDIIKKIGEAFEKGAQEPSFVKNATQNGFNINFMGSVEFEKYLKYQNELMAKAIKLAGLGK